MSEQASHTLSPELQDAFARCERLARTHYENFTVVSWLLPRRLRPAMHAVYAFCRFTDDLGDEAEGDRLALLDAWEADLRAIEAGHEPTHPIMRALARTLRDHPQPLDPYYRLIEANRMDQRVRRYRTYEDLLHYCQHSATPVGRMVLAVWGYRDEERARLSDATCTALQLANFWQDVRRDYAMGRIYLPLEDMERFGYREEDLAAGVANDAFRQLMAFEVERTRRLFAEGLRLVDLVEPELRLDLRLFSMGGLAVLEAIERQRYDVLSRRPVVSQARKLWLLAQGLAQLAARRLLPGGRASGGRPEGAPPGAG